MRWHNPEEEIDVTVSLSSMKEIVKAIPTGKRVGGDIYFHVSAIHSMPSKVSEYIRNLISMYSGGRPFDVIKLSPKALTVSFLSSPNFLQSPFPELERSRTASFSYGSPVITEESYSQRYSPPIYHRREAFLDPNHPVYPQASEQTKKAEALGLYEANMQKMGDRASWDEWVAQRGYQVTDEGIEPLSKKYKSPIDAISTKNIPSAGVVMPEKSKAPSVPKGYSIQQDLDAVEYAMGTSAGGKIPQGAKVPRVVDFIVPKGMKILDFGSGKYRIHTNALRAAGHDVTPYDFSDFDPRVLDKEYDVVFASNVLNVQGSPEMLAYTLKQIYSLVKPGGVFIANFPEQPRALRLSPQRLLQAIAAYFGSPVQIIGGKVPYIGGKGKRTSVSTSQAPVFIVQKGGRAKNPSLDQDQQLLNDLRGEAVLPPDQREENPYVTPNQINEWLNLPPDSQWEYSRVKGLEHFSYRGFEWSEPRYEGIPLDPNQLIYVNVSSYPNYEDHWDDYNYPEVQLLDPQMVFPGHQSFYRVIESDGRTIRGFSEDLYNSSEAFKRHLRSYQYGRRTGDEEMAARATIKAMNLANDQLDLIEKRNKEALRRKLIEQLTGRQQSVQSAYDWAGQWDDALFRNNNPSQPQSVREENPLGAINISGKQLSDFFGIPTDYFTLNSWLPRPAGINPDSDVYLVPDFSIQTINRSIAPELYQYLVENRPHVIPSTFAENPDFGFGRFISPYIYINTAIDVPDVYAPSFLGFYPDSTQGRPRSTITRSRVPTSILNKVPQVFGPDYPYNRDNYVDFFRDTNYLREWDNKSFTGKDLISEGFHQALYGNLLALERAHLASKGISPAIYNNQMMALARQGLAHTDSDLLNAILYDYVSSPTPEGEMLFDYIRAKDPYSFPMRVEQPGGYRTPPTPQSPFDIVTRQKNPSSRRRRKRRDNPLGAARMTFEQLARLHSADPDNFLLLRDLYSRPAVADFNLDSEMYLSPEVRVLTRGIYQDEDPDSLEVEILSNYPEFVNREEAFYVYPHVSYDAFIPGTGIGSWSGDRGKVITSNVASRTDLDLPRSMTPLSIEFVRRLFPDGVEGLNRPSILNFLIEHNDEIYSGMSFAAYGDMLQLERENMLSHGINPSQYEAERMAFARSMMSKGHRDELGMLLTDILAYPTPEGEMLRDYIFAKAPEVIDRQFDPNALAVHQSSKGGPQIPFFHIPLRKNNPSQETKKGAKLRGGAKKSKSKKQGKKR